MKMTKQLILAICLCLMIGTFFTIYFLTGMNDTSVSSTKVVTVPTYPKGINLDSVSEDFCQSVNAFSYQTASALLANNKNNSLYSPVSLYYALSLATAGANGDTQKEMLSVLHVSDSKTLATECRKLYCNLYQDTESSKCKIANSLWLNHNYSFKQEYLNNASQNFFSLLFSVDFDHPSTKKDASKWVSDNTNGTLSPEINDFWGTIQILNTVYFYDQWTNEFLAPVTNEPFYLANGSATDAPFMSKTENAQIFFGDGYIRSSLSLKNAGEMVFILPDKNRNVNELLSSPEKLKETFTGGKEKSSEITWKIPKFSYDSKLEFSETLQNLGIHKAFGEGDFSNMFSNEAYSTHYINKVIQNTHIAVNEKGVEA